MSNLRQAAEQAIDALERVMRHGQAVQQAKEALRAALAESEQEPLTDEEIQTIWAKTFEMGSSANTFARAIEKAHNITGENNV